MPKFKMYSLAKIPRNELNEYLKPLNETNTLAVLDEIAADNFMDAKYGEGINLFRLGKIYFGRYGLFGYVESNHSNNTPKNIDIWAILEIPGSLWDGMADIKGLRGYLKEAVLENKELSEESLDHPNLKGLSLFDKTYYWVFLDETPSDWPRLTEDVIDMEQKIRSTIEEFEAHLDKITYAKERPDSRMDINSLQISAPETRSQV